LGARLPLAAVAGVVLLLGVRTLYEWAHAGLADPLLARKSAWLNLPGFALRLIVCFAVWLALGHLVRRRLGGRARRVAWPRGASIALAAGYVAAFAITWSAASVDWIESLEPRFASTIFALRTATDLMLCGLACATLLALLPRHEEAMRGRATVESTHDLGRLLLAFSILWVYVWYCQYLLVWYCDIPEEAAYF